MIGKSFIRSVKTFMKDDPMTYAASLAFYTVASLPAILLIAINVLSRTYKEGDIQDDLLAKLNVYLGPGSMDQAKVILENASASYEGFIPQIIGWSILLFSATTVFISLQNGINRIWGVSPDQSSSGVLKLLMDRIISFATIVSIGFVLLVSLVIDSLIALLENWITSRFDIQYEVFIWVGNFLISLVITAAIFALIFKFLPDVKTKWRHTLVGGFFTAITFLIGKFFIGYYITTTDVGSAYGASGSLVVFLSWVYYSSVIVLFGSKFTYEYTLSMEDELVAEGFSNFVEQKVVAKDVIKVNEENKVGAGKTDEVKEFKKDEV